MYSKDFFFPKDHLNRQTSSLNICSGTPQSTDCLCTKRTSFND